MSKGISLSVGLNGLNAIHYAGWDGALNACEADATDMKAIADASGFASTLLLTSDATRDRTISIFKDAAQELAMGDLFMFTYSGHGGQVKDVSGDEEDGSDETLCLYDGQLLDDEVNSLFAEFNQGVRILVLSDSCHSGTVTREAAVKDFGIKSFFKGSDKDNLLRGSIGDNDVIYRAMPREIASKVYLENKGFYDKIAKNLSPLPLGEKVKASVLLISGCQDNQLSRDGTFNGLFTSILLKVWNKGAFAGTYKDLHAQIVALMPETQRPNYSSTGSPNVVYEEQKPFSI